MSVSSNEIPEGASLWSSRLASFAVVLVIAAALLHRFFGVPTPVALNLVALGFLIAAAAVMLGLAAAVRVWRTGRAGAARILFGVTLGIGLLTVPLLTLLAGRGYPTLNDLTTDTSDPPPFRALAGARSGIANPTAYPGAAFAELQQASYPDLKPLDVPRPPAEAFDLVVEALKRLQMTVVAESPPTEENPVGVAEAVDRTLILGFYDDVAIRVVPIGDAEDLRARVDLRSSSRYGRSDFGANAQRLREIMREIVARLEATVTASGESDTRNKKTVKPAKDAGREKSGGRRPRDGAQPNIRRAPERRAPPP